MIDNDRSWVMGIVGNAGSNLSSVYTRIDFSYTDAETGQDAIRHKRERVRSGTLKRRDI
jgi:hypothetical protein